MRTRWCCAAAVSGASIGCNRYPECSYTEPFYETVGPCPLCHEEEGGLLQKRRTRKGRQFYGCSRYPECDYSSWQMPKAAESAADASPQLSGVESVTGSAE